jgi:hypothetical protein
VRSATYEAARMRPKQCIQCLPFSSLCLLGCARGSRNCGRPSCSISYSAAAVQLHNAPDHYTNSTLTRRRVRDPS